MNAMKTSERLKQLMKFIPITEENPPENETVWMYDQEKNWVGLGCYVYVKDEGWIWALSNGVIYSEDGLIITECEIDDYNVTHWCPTPDLPGQLTEV